MKRKLPALACTIKGLTVKELIGAAEYAVSINPSNIPSFGGSPNGDLNAQAMAVLTGKYWGPAGVHLTVGFASQASAALQERVVSKFNEWSKHCNATFSIVQGAWRSADIRISLGAGGYWSYLGTDIHRVSSSQPTMNLQGFSMQTSEEEFTRVGLHEVAHTMGCPHEHMRQQIIGRLDYAKTVAEFRRTQGWSEQEVQQQIFTPLSENSIRGTRNAHDDSIMCYWFPGTCTKDGRPILGGNKITKEDGEFMGTIYPKEITLPPTAAPVKITIAFDPETKTATVIGVV